MREAMLNTPLSFLTTGMRFNSWEIASAELMEFVFRLLVNSGVRRFAIMDPMNNVSTTLDMAALARKSGGKSVVAALTFTLSPRLGAPYFTAAAQTLAKSGRFDRLYLKAPAAW